MKKCGLYLLLCLIIQTKAFAQHYMSVGLGFSGAFIKSDEYNNFVDSYNRVFAAYGLMQDLRGFGTPVGMRWELGYRYFGRINTAILAGWQGYAGEDIGMFQNGERRNLEYKLNGTFVEFEMGKSYKKFFGSGLLTLYLNRNVVFESSYTSNTTHYVC